MSKEQFFLGEPVDFKPGIKIYPPKVKDIAKNDSYGVFCRILTYSQEEVEDEFVEAKKEMEKYPTPFEFLLGNSYHSKEYETKAKEAFKFFLCEDVSFLYEQKLVLIGNLEKVLTEASSPKDLIFIKEEDFFDFQNLIRISIGEKQIAPFDPNEHPKIKEMKRKARYRDKIKAKNAAKSKDGVGMFATLVSICCMGISITPLNIGEMSYVAISSILRKYQEKEKYDLDIQSLLAGADSKKIKPQYWIKNFEE